MTRRMRRAQALLEYVLALAGMIMVVSVMWYLVRAAEKHSVRTGNLVSSEYP